MYDVSPRYRGRRFWEHALIGAAPTIHLERAREKARMRTRHPPALYPARDRKLIGMLTDGRGGRQGSDAAGFLTKKRQNVRQNVIL